MDAPSSASTAALEAEVRELRAMLESFARDLDDLAKRIRSRLR
jgi:hypothetical protein